MSFPLRVFGIASTKSIAARAGDDTHGDCAMAREAGCTVHLPHPVSAPRAPMPWNGKAPFFPSTVGARSASSPPAARFNRSAETSRAHPLHFSGTRLRVVLGSIYFEKCDTGEGAATYAIDRFWQMNDTLSEHQRAVDVPHLLGYAEALGLDASNLAGALRDGTYRRMRRSRRGAFKTGPR
jgi:hypothetical protein